MSAGGESRDGRLVVAATPIGQAGDASARLRVALGSVAVVAAEDTRRVRRLASDLDLRISGRIVSFYEANEASRTPELLARLSAGDDVLVVSDAGMPGVSDPGYRLVRAAIDAGIAVTCLPGPSAVTTALVLSGLPSDRFCFEGFLPRRAGARERALGELAGERRTMVFFEAPHRIAEMLAAAVGAFGPDRPAAVCRELTKTYEEVRRGAVAELAEWAQGEVRGELTVVIAGAPAPPPPGEAQLADLVAQAEAAGDSRKEAIAAVARAAGVPKRTVYDAVLAARPPRRS
ncbi:MAG: 16S rRNA (cytidine(1402)-2'-O)-methyltransferase [Geodermatophilaceae bacterium]|nr:16S rRNA (cytidine(1402)-2'-O)-methyltransferase [Geodermatophilaceae bacterium]MDQ3454084.1 16S rRNA (cytidine(1402)-2'-O)-methyltransferase [Actinomycetota bacterium]